MYVVWHHDDRGPEPQASCRDRSKHPDRRYTYIQSHDLFVLSRSRPSGVGPFMSLAGVEIKGLGRARLALGQVEHRLEYDEGQIEEQDRESPLSLLSRRYYLGAVEEAVAIKQHGSTICVPLAVLA